MAVTLCGSMGALQACFVADLARDWTICSEGYPKSSDPPRRDLQLRLLRTMFDVKGNALEPVFNRRSMPLHHWN